MYNNFYYKYKVMVDTSPDMINLQLGDIIEIISPENPILNLQEFFIEYIDLTKIILLNINNQALLNIIDLHKLNSGLSFKLFLLYFKI